MTLATTITGPAFSENVAQDTRLSNFKALPKLRKEKRHIYPLDDDDNEYERILENQFDNIGAWNKSSTYQLETSDELQNNKEVKTILVSASDSLLTQKSRTNIKRFRKPPC